jgi:hypothetical protein
MPSKPPVVLLAGCSHSGFLGWGTETKVVTEKKPEEPKLVDAVSSGGGCVESPENRVESTKRTEDERRFLVVSGNVSVPDASYSLSEPNLVETGWGNYTLRINSQRATDKPECGCPALANYTATIHIPNSGPHGSFALRVVHDGEVVRRENVTSR